MTRGSRRNVVWWIAAAIVIGVLGLAVWGLGVPARLARSRARTIVVTDDLGREVAIPYPVEKIISIAPSNTEILFALGLGDRIVGVTDSCDYPEEAKAKPTVGSIELNIEKIVEIDPDLVVAVGSLQRPAIERLSELGLPVLAVDPKSISGVLDSIGLLGKATGTEEAARTLVQGLEGRMKDARALAAEAASETGEPGVFVEIWDEPLMTAGPGTFIDELVEMAGGKNIASDSPMEWPEYSVEEVIEKDPEVIILTCFNKDRALERSAWQGISAYRAGRIYEIHPDLLARPGPRLIEGLEELARILHPRVAP